MSRFAKGFKDFNSQDITTIRDTLHEAVPITGTIASGTYADNNIFNNARDQFQAVYDYPYLSSSANHIFDLAIGYPSSMSGSGGAGGTVAQNRKMNMYNQMAQTLMGFSTSSQVIPFDRDGTLTTGEKINEAFFINFARLLSKDEIKKQSFSLQLLSGGTMTSPSELCTITDAGARESYRTNAAAGEYGILYTGSAPAADAAAVGSGVGLVFYQAGVVVLTSSIFGDDAAGYIGPHDSANPGLSYNTVRSMFTGSSITGACDAFRNRLHNVSFNNTIDINSTIYFCRLNHNEFNYSSNPTYLSGSKIVVKNEPSEQPVAFATSVGLYNANSELIAVAKSSQCLQKDFKTSFVIQCRLDT